MDISRLESLKIILEKDPDDTFSRYALGLEFVSNKMFNEALNTFEELINLNPNYHPTYYQLGKVYEAIGDTLMAKKIYEKGIYVTTSQSELHARNELQLALDELINFPDN